MLEKRNYISGSIQYPQRYFLQLYPVLSSVNPILSCIYAVLSCVYPILSFVDPIMFFRLKGYVSCAYRMFRVYVIHSEFTRRLTVYMVKTRGVPVVVFVLLKKIILRNRSYVNLALNSRGRRMSEKIKMVIVQYLLMHLSIEAISSKLKHFHSYMYIISRQGLYYFIKQWRSGKGLRRTRNNSILL